jgi:type IV secretory pathway VirB2 component (pilin)
MTMQSKKQFELERAVRTRRTQLVLITGLIMISTTVARALSLGGLGGGMPWEGPLSQILDSVTGPVARVIGAIAIMAIGFGIAFSEGGSMMKKVLWGVLGLTIAFNATQWGLSFMGFSGGLLV